MTWNVVRSEDLFSGSLYCRIMWLSDADNQAVDGATDILQGLRRDLPFTLLLCNDQGGLPTPGELGVSASEWPWPKRRFAPGIDAVYSSGRQPIATEALYLGRDDPGEFLRFLEDSDNAFLLFGNEPELDKLQSIIEDAPDNASANQALLHDNACAFSFVDGVRLEVCSGDRRVIERLINAK